MSFKYAVQRISDGHYVLPKTGEMKVDVHAFFSDDLYASSEEKAWKQIVDGASFPGVIGAYLMPDAHVGFGVPIGSVIVTEDTIIQGASGYDISCFTEETEVPLVDGREMSFTELVKQYGKGGEFYVYSMTPAGRVTAGKAHSPRKIRTNAKLVEVDLDNGKTICVTPDHEFMLRDGTYCEAGALMEGASLMPLYRTYEDGYCNVRHPADNSTERMYRVSFREFHGYVPIWPRVVHHDIFNPANPNRDKRNDDPRFLVEMDQHDHFLLHSRTAKERLMRGETWGAKAHKLYPEMYSAMGSANMTRLQADPAFRERRRNSMAETNKKVNARGGYKDHRAGVGQRNKGSLVKYNQSEKGRATSRAIGIRNRGRVKPNSKRQLRLEALRAKHTVLNCPHCGRECFGAKGLSHHIVTGHNNHKVVAVRAIERTADVYCLTVEKYANFALSAGVFVHNCGVLYMEADLNAGSVKSKYERRRWVNEVEKRIATGKGHSRPELMPVFNKSKTDEILRYGAKALGVDAKLCERQYIPVPETTDLTKIDKAYKSVNGQLGSVGGGNHFVEMQVDRDTGKVYIMVHCGSRGYGWQTADYFFHAGAKLRGLPSNRRDDSWLRADEPLGKEYWAHHNSAANFAVANRHIIVDGVRAATRDIFQADVNVYYEISHNLVQEETLVLPDGTTKKGFVHRKGATRAFPAGHPDLAGTQWEKTGHPCLIPGSMYEGAAILFGQAGAYKTACSVNHGSGRIMARGEAKRKLEHRQEAIDEEMNTVKRTFDGVQIEGIVSNHRHIPLDECAHVYKDLDSVLGVLESENIARVAHRLYPVCNLKGAD
jgi:tRNA-splicing ligase RtcB